VWNRTGAAPPTPVGSQLPLGGSNISTLVFRTGQAARIDYAVASGVIRDIAVRDWGWRAAVGVPIRAEGRLWGVVVVTLTHVESLPADTEARLAGFTELVATAIANTESRAGLARVADEQAALRHVATLVAAGAPPAEAFAAVTEEAGRLLHAHQAWMARYDSDGARTVVASWSSTGAAIPVGSRARLWGRNLSTLVFHSSQPERIDDYAEASGPAADVSRAVGIRASVGVPINVEGRVWGVMIVASADEPLPAGTEARLARFTELAATAIANTQARVELQSSADEQAALRRVATLVARSAPPEQVFAAVTEEAGRLFTADFAMMIRYASDGTGTAVGAWASAGAPPIAVGTPVPLGGRNLTSLVFETKQSGRIDGYNAVTGPFGDIAREAGIRALAGVPINVGGDLWGVVVVATRSAPLPTDIESRLAGFTELAATAVANAEARAEVTASRARIVAAGDEARRRIERDLHDGIQQRLVTQTLMLSGIRDKVPADVRADVDELRDELAATRQELRDLSQGVHPAILVEVGLGAAIRALARRSPLPVRVQMRTADRLPSSAEITAYYVAAEAFTNAAKHANASAVDILIEEADGTLTVQVRDDGAGGADASRGSGLTGLRDRVEAVGGSMTLDSTAGAGTVLTVLLPITPDGA
jgi:signal transduction histidine kinase